MLVSVLLLWIGCLWFSLFLMLASAPGAVVNSTTKVAADLWETLYYAGYTLSTLGIGDFTASGDGWRVLSSAAAFCGLTLITAAITYIVPVVSAANLQYQLSLLITSMGRTPQEIVVNSWNGSDFSSFYDNASDIRQMLVAHTLNHHAYPVIRCFHDSQAGKNVIPAIATLDEVLRLLSCVKDEVPQDRLKRKMLLDALDHHLEMQQANYLTRLHPEHKPAIADLTSLSAAGIPLKDDEETLADGERRTLLSTMLAADGWRWTSVYGHQVEQSDRPG